MSRKYLRYSDSWLKGLLIKKFFSKISGHQQRWPRPLPGAILIPPAPLVVADSEVDLCGIAWPVCLLKFKSALSDICSRNVLEVLTQDPDVVENIILIVDRSEDTLINQQKEGDIYRLSVEKRA